MNRINMKKSLMIIFLLSNLMFLCACSNNKNVVEEKIENESIVEINDASLNMLNTFEIKKDKITFVNFWATWCGPCVGEMSDLQELYDEMKNDEKVEMIFVNLGDPKKEVEKFLEDNKYTMPIYCDEEGMLGGKYEIYAIPQTFIFDKKGNIVDKIVGANTKDVYNNAIKAALEK